jgi:hypothetical protein
MIGIVKARGDNTNNEKSNTNIKPLAKTETDTPVARMQN